MRNPDDISYKQALIETAKLAVPVIGSQIITMGGNFIGVIFVSKLGPQNLAASNLAYSIQNFMMTTITAAISSGTNIAAKKLGAEGKSALGGILHKSWIVSGIFSAPIIGGLLMSKPLLLKLHQDPVVVDLTSKYFNGFVWGLPAMFMLTSNRQIAIATKDPFFPYISLIFVLGYQIADTSLSYCLVNGKCYLPKLGFAGLSYSNSITVWTTVLTFAGYMALSPRYKDFGITRFHTKNFWPDLWEIFQSGLSMAAKVAVELGTMAGASIMIGAMSANQQAAQEAAFQYVFIMNPVMFGLMDIASKKVAFSLGELNKNNIIKYGNAAVLLGVISSLAFLTLFASMPFILLRAFIDPNDQNNQQILSTARWLLLVNGLTQITDTIRTILLGSLNGAEDRIKPTLYIILTLAAVFVPLSYVMGFQGHLQALGVMMARAISIALGATLLSYRWFMTDTLRNAKPSGNPQILSINNSLGADPQNNVVRENAANLESSQITILTAESINADDVSEKTPLIVRDNKQKSLTGSWANFWKHSTNKSATEKENHHDAQTVKNYCVVM